MEGQDIEQGGGYREQVGGAGYRAGNGVGGGAGYRAGNGGRWGGRISSRGEDIEQAMGVGGGAGYRAGNGGRSSRQ